MSIIFTFLSAVVSVYTLLCFIRILLTWIPNRSYNWFTRFLSTICDPYLNMFHRLRFLVIGSFDFSPALALCLLGAATVLLQNLSHKGHLTVGLILGMLVSLAWSVASSIIVFLIILFIVRLIIMGVNKQERSPNYIIQQIDYSIAPFVYRISRAFSGNRNVSYKSALIVSLVMFIIIQIGGTLLFNYLSSLCELLPF